MSPTLKDVSNLNEMRQVLEDYLLNTVNKETKEEKIEEKTDDVQKNRAKIKSYIIESNVKTPFETNAFGKEARIERTSDRNLFILKVFTRQAHENIYIDTTNERFWVLHSAEKSEHIDGIINRIVCKNQSKLDFAWFSSSFLEAKDSLGRNIGFSIKFKNEFLSEEDEGSLGIRNLSMLLWGGKPSQILEWMRQSADINSGAALSRLNLLVGGANGFVKDHLHCDGKFTLTKGDSIDRHIWIIEQLKQDYGKKIERIEKDYRISYIPKETHIELKGTYSLIQFKKSLEELPPFINRLFDCREPFRLFGLPRFIDKKFAQVFAVDLHTHAKFNVELTPDYMRIFLYGDSCGNVLMRLMTNLQRYYDSRVKLLGCDNEQLI